MIITYVMLCYVMLWNREGSAIAPATCIGPNSIIILEIIMLDVDVNSNPSDEFYFCWLRSVSIRCCRLRMGWVFYYCTYYFDFLITASLIGEGSYTNVQCNLLCLLFAFFVMLALDDHITVYGNKFSKVVYSSQA